MGTERLTMAQALVRFLCAQRTETEGGEAALFAGVWAIFGHGNVAGLGEALQSVQDRLPTLRAHNEQAMAHAAIAFAKASARRRMMACTTSIGPGATNMVTPIADAMMDSVPTVFITGQVRTELIGTDGFQEADVTGITMPVVKHSFLVTDAAQIPDYIHKAFHIAKTGRPGPVLVDIPQDLSRMEIDYEPI